jgi:transcriptional regulator with XRE-family HTH domain
MAATNVLLPIHLPTQADLRDAVSAIIRRVQLDHDLTDDELARKLTISIGTVRNARNKACDLNAATIAVIGASFGAEVLDPYAKLYGARNVPLDVCEEDALPSLTGAVHRLAVAQSPSSPGGTAVTHSELLEMLPDLRTAQRAINSLICRAERIAA